MILSVFSQDKNFDCYPCGWIDIYLYKYIIISGDVANIILDIEPKTYTILSNPPKIYVYPIEAILDETVS